MNDQQQSTVIGGEYAYRDSSEEVGFAREWPDPRRLGVVEFLRRDQSSLSQHALDCIASLNRTGRFRVTAHLQDLLTRLALLVGSAALASYALSRIAPLQIGSAAVRFHSSNAYEVVALAVLVWAAWATWTLLDCMTNTITIANGRVRWGHGVLGKHFEALDVWTVGDIDLGRNALQRLTGDGTLILRGTRHDRPTGSPVRRARQLSLTGVAHGRELEGVYVSLLYLNFLLRAHPGLADLFGDSRP